MDEFDPDAPAVQRAQRHDPRDATIQVRLSQAELAAIETYFNLGAKQAALLRHPDESRNPTLEERLGRVVVDDITPSIEKSVRDKLSQSQKTLWAETAGFRQDDSDRQVESPRQTRGLRM